MFGLGMHEMVLVILPFIALYVYVLWRVVSKTGNPGVLSLLFLIPVVNVIFVIYLAFSEWPIQRELNRLQGRSTGS